MRFFCTLLFVILLPIGSVFAHDFNDESLEYLLSAKAETVTRTEFESQMKKLNVDVYDRIGDEYSKIAIALAIPGKSGILDLAKSAGTFNIEDVTLWIQQDPMLEELGSEAIHAYLKDRMSGTLDDIPEYNVEIPAEIIETYQALRPPKQSFVDYVTLGRDHIISGYDHLLFVLALVLALPSVKYILQIVTTFTVAHSITILLGSLGVISLPGVFVESVIVISIGIAACMTWFQQVGEPTENTPWKEITLVFILGLIHGLGFSSFFIDMSGSTSNLILPILGFNIGVELGQLLVLILYMIVLTGLYAIFKNHKNTIKKGLIIIISLIATYRTVGMWL